MAWIMVINGISLNINEAEDFRQKLAKDAGYKKILKEIEKKGFFVNDLDDYDKPSFHISWGLEMWPERHIYQHSISNMSIPTVDYSVLKQFVEPLKKIFKKHTALPIDETEGLTIHYFD